MGAERKQWDGVRPLGKSSIRLDFVYKGVRCREIYKLAPTTKNLERVRNYRGAILTAIANKEFDYSVVFPESPNRFRFLDAPSAGLKVEDYLADWLAKQVHLKSSTLGAYKGIVENTLTSAFGQTFLPDLKRSDVRDWCAKQICGNKRLANVQSVLRKALQDAVTDELIDVNPLFNWTFKKNAAPRKSKVDPFDAAEQLAILANCESPMWRNLFRFAFWTGLRTSELCALEWGDIDWVRKVVRVERAMTRFSDEPEVPKTQQSKREVKLLPSALDALNAQKEHSLLANKVIFLNPHTAKLLIGDTVTRKPWHRALIAAEVRYRNQYQTRHTYASMMLTAGEDPAWVASQMGHADTGMIFRNYGRWIPNTRPDMGDKAVAMFDKPILSVV